MIHACARSPCGRTTSPITKHSPGRLAMNAQMLPLNLTMPNPATTTTAATAESLPLDMLKQRLRRLNLYGLLTHLEELATEPWLARVVQIEESERLQRSFK